MSRDAGKDVFILGEEALEERPVAGFEAEGMSGLSVKTAAAASGDVPFYLGDVPRRRPNRRPRRERSRDGRQTRYRKENRWRRGRGLSAGRMLRAIAIGSGGVAVAALVLAIVQLVGRSGAPDGAMDPEPLVSAVSTQPYLHVGAASAEPQAKPLKRDSRPRSTRERERQRPRVDASSRPAPALPAPPVPVAASPSPLSQGGGFGGGETFGFEE
jgi:hypothetical protein